jgi:hypothetical protein
MSIVQDEKELEYWSDQKLLEEAQTPTGRMPLFLIHTQIEKRKNYRASANARNETPATTIYEEDVAEFGGGGLGSMQQQMSMPPPPTQQMPPPQQMPMSMPPSQAGMGVAPMNRGGLIRAQDGVHLPRKDLSSIGEGYRGTGRGNLTRKQIEELEKKIRSYKSNLKLSPFENIRRARNMSGGGLIQAYVGSYLPLPMSEPLPNKDTVGNIIGVPTRAEIEKKKKEMAEIKRLMALAREGEGGIPWGGITTMAGGLALMTPWGRTARGAKELGKGIYQWGAKKAAPATAWAAKKYGQRVARKDPTKLQSPTSLGTMAGGTSALPVIGRQSLKDVSKLKLLGKGAQYGGAAYLGGTGAYQIGKSLSGKGGKTDQEIAEDIYRKLLDKGKTTPTVGLPSITDSQSAEPEYRRFYSEYMQPQKEFEAELTDVESYRTTPKQRKNEALALAYSGLGAALGNVGMENIIKGISEITPEVIGLRKMQTEEQRVVDKNEADLRKGRRSDRMMAINMQLEWEKMENLKSSYEAAGKMEILKAAWEAFTQQMPSKDMRSLDDFLYFFEVGEFPDKNQSPSDAVAAAGKE